MTPLKKASILTALALTALLVTGGLAAAADKELSVGTARGGHGDSVTLPIVINNPTGVGGMAFSLQFDPTVLEYTGLTQAGKTINDGSTYVVNPNDPPDQWVYETTGQEGQVASTLFYQVNDDNATSTGRVLVAAASAQALDGLSGGTVFNVTFDIKNAGYDDYPVRLQRTIIWNPNAGYPTPTPLPVLVGMPADDPDPNGYYPTPTYSTTLVDGIVTVEAPTWTISGNVTYEGSADPTDTDGSRVVLSRQTAAGGYVKVTEKTVTGGSYSFGSLPDGNYKVKGFPYEPGYYTKEHPVVVAGGNMIQDIELPTGQVIAGRVTVNGGNDLPGLRIRIKSGNTVIGTYPTDGQGNFVIPPLDPNGVYTIWAVYGDTETEVTGDLSDDDLADIALTLRSISGTVNGIDNADILLVATSQTAGLQVGVTVTAGSPVAYTIPNLLPAGDYIVSAASLNYAIRYYSNVTDITQATFVDTTAADQTGKDFTFPAGDPTISGSVVKDGNPVGGVSLFAFETNTYGLIPAVSQNNGTYDMTVAPGTYELFALHNGNFFYYSGNGSSHATSRAAGDATPIVLAGDDYAADLDVTLCDCSLTGKVTFERADGDPLPGALITVESDGIQAAAFTVQNGTYTIAGLCEGTYLVEMTPLGTNYPVQSATITIDGTNCQSATVNFIIDTGNSLGGTVTEGDSGNNDPVNKAMVYLKDSVTGRLVGGRIRYTDPQGEYTFLDVPDGIYDMKVAHRDYQTATEDDVQVDRDIDDQDFSLTKGDFIHGVVKEDAGNDGDPGNDTVLLAGATVVAQALTGDEVPRYATTNTSGAYAIYGLDSAKTYLVLAAHPGHLRGATTATPTSAPGTEVNFGLKTPAVTITLNGSVLSGSNCTPPDTGIPGARVVASYGTGASSPPFFRLATTDANGDYSFTNLPQPASQQYTLVATLPGSPRSASTTVDTSGGSPVTATDLVFDCGSAISGVITPATAGYVVLFDAAQDFVGFAFPDQQDGSYRFEDLAVGSYFVGLVASDNTITWYDSTNPNGSATIGSTATPPATGVSITIP